MMHWRLSADVAGTLPSGNQPLPPADTRGDPMLVDLGRIYASPYSASFTAAAGIAGAELDGSAELASSRRAGWLDSAVGGVSDQYLDSAPVPGLVRAVYDTSDSLSLMSDSYSFCCVTN